MLYPTLLKASGLSQREAAAFHGVRLDTVKSWASGRRAAAPGAVGQLAELIYRMVAAFDATLDRIDTMAEAHGAPDVVELGLAADDAEAQALGWPAASVQAVVLGLVAGHARAGLNGVNVRIVPRASTPLTAAAADAHEAGDSDL